MLKQGVHHLHLSMPYAMLTSSSPPSNVPATLTTLPLEIFRLIMSELEDDTLFVLRPVCREFNHRAMDRIHPYFGYISAVFSLKGLCRVLKMAHSLHFQTLAEIVSFNMTVKGRELASPSLPKWKRDRLGYLAHPEKIYEIRTLKNISSKLVNCRQFQLSYTISKDTKGDDWRQISLQKTVESILAICATMKARIKAVEISCSWYDVQTITIDPTYPILQWDKSTPLLDAMCGPLSTLDIMIERDMPDLKWIVKFFTKCSTLEQLSLRNKSSSFSTIENPLQHRFFDDISATLGILPPLQSLMLQNMDFTREELVRFVGRFKDTIRSIILKSINMYGQKEWPSVLEWLRENILNLEKFEFQGLTYDYGFVGDQVICFDSIIDDPEVSFRALSKRLWGSFLKLPNGTFALDMVDDLAYLKKDEVVANLDKWKYDVNTNPYEPRRAFTVKFEGSKFGAQEALHLLVLAAVPQSLQKNQFYISLRETTKLFNDIEMCQNSEDKRRQWIKTIIAQRH